MIGYAKSLKEEQRKSLEAVYQGNSVFYGYGQDMARTFAEDLPFMTEYKEGQCSRTPSAIASHDHLFYV